MSRRPVHSDDEILARTVVAVRRHGPRVTLTRIAREAGLTPARLVQRFGSRGELLALAERRADERIRLAVFRDLEDPGFDLDALVERLADVAERNARRLHLLSNSYLFDPGHLATRTGARDAKRREADYLASFRTVLVRAGDLNAPDATALARALYVTWIGTYTAWAYAPTGSLRDAVTHDLTFLLRPYRQRARAPRRGRVTAPVPAGAT